MQPVALAPLSDQDVTATALLALSIAYDEPIEAAISGALFYRGRIQSELGAHEDADFRAVTEAVDAMRRLMRENIPRDAAPRVTLYTVRCERILGPR